MRGLRDRLTCPRSSTMSCRTKVQTQIFPFHSIAAETKRLLFNANDIKEAHLMLMTLLQSCSRESVGG